ncbi:hypothetical protein ACQP1V_27535 [Microtetraspora malaysiensis]|uniref:hypothetical protein n=1 Tax=Microtetraspora malaysiensis TaxID=161358 RepID=UPI003D911B4E
MARPVAYARSKEELQLAQGMLCTLWHERDPRLSHEAGRRYRIGMWLPGTRWQLSAVMRVLHLFLRDEQPRAAAEAVRLSRIVEHAARQLTQLVEEASTQISPAPAHSAQGRSRAGRALIAVAAHARSQEDGHDV